jgi:hypothetical protein
LIHVKVQTILKGSLVSIPSPSPSVKIQFMGGKVCLRRKDKTLLGVVNKLLKTNFPANNSKGVSSKPSGKLIVAPIFCF